MANSEDVVVSPALQVTLSGGLSFGIPLVLAIRELIIMRRRPRNSGGGPGPGPAPTPRPISGGGRSLPICLIPTEQWRAPERTRELANV